MSEINSGKINMAPKDEKVEKRTCPDLGFAQWPIGLNAQNYSKLQIGIRTNLNMINLDLKKVCCFTKVQVKDFFCSNKAWNSILRGFLDPKFHGEYESDKKWFFFYFHQIWWCQYIIIWIFKLESGLYSLEIECSISKSLSWFKLALLL